VFRDTELSDRIGFKYQDLGGEEAAEDFVQTVLGRAPGKDESDVLLTVILDGENAWEWYRKNNDGKEFLHALYRKLSRLYLDRRVITTTMSEYLAGNRGRGIDPHPVEKQPMMNTLWPGSWINANFDTWIGEPEENTAWEYLLKTRRDLANSGILLPDPAVAPPRRGSKAWCAYRAWEEMYAAEGSDWFWWYGEDQTAPGGDRPFDLAFITHLENVYRYAAKAGVRMTVPEFAPIIQVKVSPSGLQGQKSVGGGTMAMGSVETRTVIFRCDARREKVSGNIYIAGNDSSLGAWTPNSVALHDDGLDGDETAKDGVWALRVDLPVGKEVQYKFTNSGVRGQWSPGEEFPLRNRSLTVSAGTEPLIIQVIFGEEE
jgi:hypothetical protein